MISTVRGCGRTYPATDGTVAGEQFKLFERFAPEVKGDGAAVAGSAVQLGGVVQVCDL